MAERPLQRTSFPADTRTVRKVPCPCGCGRQLRQRTSGGYIKAVQETLYVGDLLVEVCAESAHEELAEFLRNTEDLHAKALAACHYDRRVDPLLVTRLYLTWQKVLPSVITLAGIVGPTSMSRWAERETPVVG